MMKTFVLVLALCLTATSEAEQTLPGACPAAKPHENWNHEKFSGQWYNVASFASDNRPIYDCAMLDFQEDNMGYTLNETFVVEGKDGRSQNTYLSRVDPTFDAGNKARFIVSHEDGDKVLQFPFSILSTDYETYAIAYTCKTFKKSPKTHYVFTWILSRNMEPLEGDKLKKVEDALSKYPELVENRKSFVLKNFSEASCAYSNKLQSGSFTGNFW